MKAPRRPRRVRKAPATLGEALAMFDGEREGRTGLPDIEADIARLKALLAQAGLTIVPLHMNLVDSEPLITGPQIRAGLALLGWTIGHLAEAAGLSRGPLEMLCKEHGRASGIAVSTIRRAFHAAGVAFQFGPDGALSVNYTPPLLVSPNVSDEG